MTTGSYTSMVTYDYRQDLDQRKVQRISLEKPQKKFLQALQIPVTEVVTNLQIPVTEVVTNLQIPVTEVVTNLQIPKKYSPNFTKGLQNMKDKKSVPDLN